MEILLIALCVIYGMSVIFCVIQFWDDMCTGKTGVVPYIIAVLPIVNTYMVFHRIRHYMRYRN